MRKKEASKMLAQRVLVALWMATVVTAYNVTVATPENYSEITQGKSVFVRFFAPWVGALVYGVLASHDCHCDASLSFSWNNGWLMLSPFLSF
jgi:hypothetical protein